MPGPSPTAVVAGVVTIACAAGSAAAGQSCGTAPVGDHELYYCMAGNGTPAVVLEAGMRNDHRTWAALVAPLARHTTVITYDRAGLGRSEAGPVPRTSARIAAELRALLETIGVAEPIVLVGHSIGGRHVRTFAAEYPGAVAGLALLDSPHESFEANRLTLLSDTEARARLASLEANRASLPSGIRLEYQGIEASAAPGPLPPVPLFVVAAGRHQWVPPATAAAHERMWQEGQRRLAAQHPDGRYVILRDAGHNLHVTRPDTVTTIVLDLLARARARPNGR